LFGVGIVTFFIVVIGLWAFTNFFRKNKIRGVIPREHKKLKLKETELKQLLQLL
jgi:hypothetical protein